MPRQGLRDGYVSHLHHSVSADRDLRYIVCDNPDTLIWLANLAAIELNIPLARLKDPDAPDLLLFDIDPSPLPGFLKR